jgi:ATP:ADP antiporter, AAA family
MSGLQRIFWLLNIQPVEWPMVKRLFLLQFFQGAGIALFFTSALSQFLKRFPISELAYVFILSAFLLWITGYVCNRLEHRLAVRRLSIILTLIIAGSMLFFWAGQFIISHNWFYYLMLAWFNVLYLINNLEFWGMAAQLYDVRQSKRLFGIISSGDIPAKFLGYTFALLLVPYIGAQNLLLTGFFGVMISLLFINKVFQSTEWKGFHHHTHKIKQHHTVSAKALWKNLISNRLIFDTAVLSMIAFTGFVLVEYAFYAEIKESKNYKTDEAFATFTAMFMGCARLFAWILKLGLTSRLVTTVGNRNALLITPIALLIFNLSILLIYENDAKSNLILYVFGAAAILVDALRASINSPVLLTILQPLSTPDRLRAHNIVKGVMDPFAYLAVGFLLFELYNWHVYKLALLSWILIAVSVLWIVYVIRVHKQYIKTLIQTISSRYFQTDDVHLTGKATIEKIAIKIETGTELEVLYLLKLLEKEKAQEGLVAKALQHASAEVRLAALKLVQQKKLTTLVPAVQKLTIEDPSSAVRAKAIAVVAALSYNHLYFIEMLGLDEEDIQIAAIESIVQYAPAATEQEPALTRLWQWVASADMQQRMHVVQIISRARFALSADLLNPLLHDKDKEVRYAAIIAAGKSADPKNLALLPAVFDVHPKQVLQAFITAGNKSLPQIRLLLQQTSSSKQQSSLIIAAGRIGGEDAAHLLLYLLEQQTTNSAAILKALNRMNYRSDEQHKPLIDERTNQHLLRAVELLFMLNRLQENEKTNNFLYNSLQLELLEERDTVLNLFSFYSEKEQVDKIKKALQLNQRETAANALELIEVTIRKDFAFTFNTVFEEADISFRCSRLRKMIPDSLYKSIEQVVTHILEEEKEEFNHWTKACSLHSCKFHKLHVKETIFHKYLQSENRLLRETAAYAVT